MKKLIQAILFKFLPINSRNDNKVKMLSNEVFIESKLFPNIDYRNVCVINNLEFSKRLLKLLYICRIKALNETYFDLINYHNTQLSALTTEQKLLLITFINVYNEYKTINDKSKPINDTGLKFKTNDEFLSYFIYQKIRSKFLHNLSLICPDALSASDKKSLCIYLNNKKYPV